MPALHSSKCCGPLSTPMLRIRADVRAHCAPTKGGGASMPRNATARREPEVADEAATTRVDELIQLGRGQGYLSLTELRAAFGDAGVSPAEGRSIIRELAEAGVRLGDEPGAGTAPEGTGTAPKRARTGTEDMTTAQLTAPRDAAEEPALDSLDAEAEA